MIRKPERILKTRKDEESFHENKRDELTASDKDSWFDQPHKKIERTMLQQKLTLAGARFVPGRRFIAGHGST